MLSNIVPDLGAESTLGSRTVLDFEPVHAAPLAWAISRMAPGLCAPGLLDGETLGDALARDMAAADILDDLLAEYAAGGA